MLIHDLSEAGLRVQVRHGHGEALLVCIRIPRDHLGNLVHLELDLMIVSICRRPWISHAGQSITNVSKLIL
jgi:hypothetical protein